MRLAALVLLVALLCQGTTPSHGKQPLNGNQHANTHQIMQYGLSKALS